MSAGPGHTGELQALRAELAALRDDVQWLSRQLLSSSDRRHVPALLGVAGALMGARTWRAGELVAAARASGSASPLAPVLAAHAAVDGSLKVFGKYLARCDGVSSGGLRLCKVGGGAGGEDCLYTVVPLSPPSKPIEALAAGSGTAHDGYSFVRSPDGPA